LEVLDTDQILDIGLKFAAIEKKLGEINRARAILVHLSQFCDPSKPEFIEYFWKEWEEFELNYGNEDTYTEMMRTKRSVSARYSLNAPLFIVENKVPV
jgi:pre-mRNA-splicing factor SYF1